MFFVNNFYFFANGILFMFFCFGSISNKLQENIIVRKKKVTKAFLVNFLKFNFFNCLKKIIMMIICIISMSHNS